MNEKQKQALKDLKDLADDGEGIADSMRYLTAQMQRFFFELQSQVSILRGDQLPHTGKKPEGTRSEKA